MANQTAELLKQLKRNGWTFVKHGTNHSVYEKEGKTLLIPRGSKIYSRSYKQMVWKINGKTDRSKKDVFTLGTFA